MLGHEGVRAAIRDHLMATVPARLAAIRDRLEVDGPRDPVAYRLADSLGINDTYPLVLIRSTDSPAMRADTAVAAGMTSAWTVGYSIEIGVACDMAAIGDWEGACVERDRLLLAVREAILYPVALPDDIQLQRSTITEDTGPAAETLRGNPLAVGSLKIGAIVTETLAPLPAPSLIAGADQVTTPKDPSQTL